MVGEISECAQKESNKPIDITTYNLTSELPESYQDLLPDGVKIARELNILMEE